MMNDERCTAINGRACIRTLRGTESRVANSLARLWWSYRQLGASRTFRKALRNLSRGVGVAATTGPASGTPNIEAMRTCSWIVHLPNTHATEIEVSSQALAEFMEATKYPKYYYRGGKRLTHALWHYVGVMLAELSASDVVLDVGAQSGTWGHFVRRKYRCRVIDVDVEYPPGVHGDRVGADAAHIPLPDRSVSRIVSFCALNCFEGSADIRFFREASRLLPPAGRLVIVPICIGDEHLNLYDPRICTREDAFDVGARRVSWAGWGNNFGRWYDRAAFESRVAANLPGFEALIVTIRHPFTEIPWPGTMHAAVFIKGAPAI